MVETTYSSQRISFLRGVLGVLEANVREERKRIVIAEAEAKTLDETEAVAARYRELYDRVQGLGNKLVIVGLSSLVESIFGMMLKKNAPVLHPGDESDWGALRKGVDKMHGVDMDTLPGWTHAKLVRLLSNCFKHGDGFALSTSPSGKKLKSWSAMNQGASVGFDWRKHVKRARHHLRDVLAPSSRASPRCRESGCDLLASR